MGVLSLFVVAPRWSTWPTRRSGRGAEPGAGPGTTASEVSGCAVGVQLGLRRPVRRAGRGVRESGAAGPDPAATRGRHSRWVRFLRHRPRWVGRDRSPGRVREASVPWLAPGTASRSRDDEPARAGSSSCASSDHRGTRSTPAPAGPAAMATARARALRAFPGGRPDRPFSSRAPDRRGGAGAFRGDRPRCPRPPRPRPSTDSSDSPCGG